MGKYRKWHHVMMYVATGLMLLMLWNHEWALAALFYLTAGIHATFSLNDNGFAAVSDHIEDKPK